MADLFKTLAQAFRKVEHPEKKPQTLRERLGAEQERLKAEEERWRSGGGQALRLPGETEAGARVEDCRALTTLLRWKMDVYLENVTENPVNVDGYFFGVQRYVTDSEDDEQAYDIRWKLSVFRPCTHCKALIPTLELGDYSEVVAAGKQVALGQDAYVPKSTAKLAAYLNEIEGGRYDPHLPRVCPRCHNLLKGLKTS
jgi:hypothetical protein